MATQPEGLDLLHRMYEAGVVPRGTRRVIIDVPMDGQVVMYVDMIPTDTDDALLSLLQEAAMRTVDDDEAKPDEG